MKMIVAVHAGKRGFVRFVHDLAALGVLDRAETVGWIELHGAVLRLGEPIGDDEEALAALARELEGEIA